ncbi:hypothetical protein AXF42_Ash019155 [Apostasia shenzhenica]|uniref:Uncharacterized protein n=1 Tax=Apostasia shenzhenica TaxID=1088818 RepID=A0A2I0B2C7_9ASPA|nr:hypothetical protein AXF42_Ash019155 [Apostasia shenzhenica]
MPTTSSSLSSAAPTTVSLASPTSTTCLPCSPCSSVPSPPTEASRGLTGPWTALIWLGLSGRRSLSSCWSG